MMQAPARPLSPAAVFSKKDTFAQSKRGFKEKLLETLSQAEAVATGMVKSAGAEPSRQNMLVEALVDGNVQAFVSLFYLTAPDGRASDEDLIRMGIDPERFVGQPDVPIDKIPYVKDNLAAAEHAERAAEYRIV